MTPFVRHMLICNRVIFDPTRPEQVGQWNGSDGDPPFTCCEWFAVGVNCYHLMDGTSWLYHHHRGLQRDSLVDDIITGDFPCRRPGNQLRIHLSITGLSHC